MSDKRYYTKDGMVTLDGFIRGYQQEVTLSNLPMSVVVSTKIEVPWTKRAQIRLVLNCANFETQLFTTKLCVYTADRDKQDYISTLSTLFTPWPLTYHEGLQAARKAWKELYAEYFTPVLKTIPCTAMYDRARRCRVKGYRISNRYVIVRKTGVGVEASDTLMGFGLSWAKQHPSAEGSGLYTGFHIYTTY